MELKAQELSDVQLAEAARNGNLDSFGALYQRYYSSMVALAYAMLTDIHLAEDAAQESFAIACRDLNTLRRTEKFGYWLAGICRNVARGILREKGKSLAPDFCQSSARGCLTADEYQDSQECRQIAIRKALWQLRDSERELIVLRYYDGFSHAQISKVLDISPSAINGRLVRAKRKIAKYLKRNGFTGDDYETP
jgi:RNA polymerase sigma-70 factor (ECF subfamily)